MIQKLFVLFFLFSFLKAEAQSSALFVADSLFRSGKYANAISVYQKINSNSPEIYIKTARAYRALGNYGKALDNFESAFSKKKTLPIALSDYGELLYQVHHYKKADSVFRVLTQQYPKNPDFHYQLGLAKEQLEDSTAIEQFQKTFSLDSTHQRTIYKLALHQMKQENYTKVESLGKIALESYSANAKIIGLLAQNAMALDNYELAIKRFQWLIDHNYRSGFIHEKLAMAYYSLDELGKALEQYKILLTSSPKHITALFNSGKINNLLGNYTSAESLLKKAIFLKKHRLDEIYQALGMNYKLQKKYGKAIDYFKLALNVNPKNLRSQFGLAIAADNYYKDLQTRINYYKVFIRKFKSLPNAKSFLRVAKYRVKQLNKELFLKGKMKTEN